MTRRLAMVVVALLALAVAEARAGTWGTAAPIPGSQASFEFVSVPVDAGQAGNGDAAVAWIDPLGRARVALRTAGVWAVTPMPRQGGNSSTQVALAMNQRGDVAVAYNTDGGLNGRNRMYLAYKPDDGPWQLPAAETPADQFADTITAPSVAINADGDAVAGWLDQQDNTAQFQVRTSVYDRPASGTGSWAAAETVDPGVTGVTALITFVVGPSASPVAIDNAGNALVAFMRRYGEYTDPSTSQTRSVTSVRYALRPAGGAWGSSSAATPEPGGVTHAGLPSTPSFWSPVLAADPATGQIAATIVGAEGAFVRNPGPTETYDYDNAPAWFVPGTVAGGLSGRSSTQTVMLGRSAGAAEGHRIAGGVERVGVGPGTTWSVVTGIGGGGATLTPVETAPIADDTTPFDVDLAAGATGLVIAGAGGNEGAAGGTFIGTAAGFGPPTPLWPAGVAGVEAVAANCRGDALAATAHNTTAALHQILVADYASGVAEPCGGAPAGTPTPEATSTATATPTSTAAATATGTATATASAVPIATATPTAPPAAAPSAGFRRLGFKKGRVRFAVGPASTDLQATVTLRQGSAKGRKLGAASAAVSRGATVTVAVKLARAGRRTLRKRGKLKLVATLVLRDRAGGRATQRLTFTLR